MISKLLCERRGRAGGLFPAADDVEGVDEGVDFGFFASATAAAAAFFDAAAAVVARRMPTL